MSLSNKCSIHFHRIQEPPFCRTIRAGKEISYECVRGYIGRIRGICGKAGLQLYQTVKLTSYRILLDVIHMFAKMLDQLDHNNDIYIYYIYIYIIIVIIYIYIYMYNIIYIYI